MSGNVKKKTSSKNKANAVTQSNGLKKVIACCIVFVLILVLASVGVIGYTLYYVYNNPPTTVAVGNVDSLAYDPDGRYFIELKMFTNEKNNGCFAYEYKMNFYTDTAIPTTDSGKQNIIDQNTNEDGQIDTDGILGDVFKTVYSQGVQFLDKVEFGSVASTAGLLATESYVYPKDAYYYNTDDDTSYTAIQALDYLDKWIIDFGEGNLGRIKQDKGFVSIGSANALILSIDFRLRYDVNLLMQDIYNSAASLDYGKQVLMFDLSDYFTFEYFSTDDLQFHTPATDEQHLYVNVLVDKSENGIISAEQSQFGLIAGDSNWSYSGVEPENYYTSHVSINLTQADFDIQNGLLVLNQNAIEYFSRFDPETIDLNINIDLTQTEGTGFAHNAFGDLSVDHIIVTSTYPTTFTYYTAPCEIVANDNVTLEVVV